LKLGRIAVVGRGKVGSALAAALREALRAQPGRKRPRTKPPEVTLVPGRGLRKLRADTVIVAIPDASLAHLSLALSEKDALVASQLRRHPVVLHVSGLRDASALSPLHEAGFAVGAMHPLVSFADRRRPPPLTGTTLVVSGDRQAVEAAEVLAHLLGMVALIRPKRRPLSGPAYHAAAALLANGAVALAAEASAILAVLGVPPRARERALGGLLSSVAHNVGAVGLPQALTGPIVRGDASAVALHLRALSPASREAYAQVGQRILPVAVRAGLPRAPAKAIEALLLDASPSPPSRTRRARAR
jgi:predicted short-subunit dehydrogenase-like oxidoreductase (DUF2520 family)